jgi:dephospho-CoA kinase
MRRQWRWPEARPATTEPRSGAAFRPDAWPHLNGCSGKGKLRNVIVHVFGLTGGFASGKSAVAARFAARGVPVLDADQLARDVVEPGSEGLRAVVAEFGPEMEEARGRLDRKRLGALVFAQPEARQRLERITHPRIQAAMRERAAALAARGEALCCYEAPLLVEVGSAAKLRPLVVVSASVEAQVERGMRRDGLSEAEAKKRIAAQFPLEKKLAVADYVIDNSSTLEHAVAEADRVLDAICKELGVPPERYPRTLA